MANSYYDAMDTDAYGGKLGMVGYSPMSREDYYGIGQDTATREAGLGAMQYGMQGAQMGGQMGGGIGAAIGGILGALGGGIGKGVMGKKADQRARKKQQAWDKAQRQLARERYQQRVAAHNLVKTTFSPLNASMMSAFGAGSGMDLDQTPWGNTRDDANKPAQRKPLGGLIAGDKYQELSDRKKSTTKASGGEWDDRFYDGKPRGKTKGKK